MAKILISKPDDLTENRILVQPYRTLHKKLAILINLKMVIVMIPVSLTGM